MVRRRRDSPSDRAKLLSATTSRLRAVSGDPVKRFMPDRLGRPAALVVLLLALATSRALAGPIEDRLAEALADLDTRALTTGVLAERVVPVVDLSRFDGGPGAGVATRETWLQIHHQLRFASNDPSRRPGAGALRDRARVRGDAIPIGLVFDRYQTIRAGAIESGALAVRGGRFSGGGPEAFEMRTAFAAAALQTVTYRGAAVRFVLDRGWFFSNTGVALDRFAIDFDDGQGSREVSVDRPVMVRYGSTGPRTIRLEARDANGETLKASFAFVVAALATPNPNDTLHVTGTIPYLGGVASGDAYVYLAPGHASLVNPAVVVEGFDLDNSMNWDELYALLNQQNLVETLRADGYDAVVLNFSDATDYIQRNAFVLTGLLAQVRAAVGPATTIALAGASMGGLVSRYALAWLETNGIPHGVRTYISFDGPHLGADIPLGIQYWVKFFSGQSSDAAFLLSRLDRPAARQMLVYHYTDPATPSGQADPLRGTLISDLAAIGDWPNQTRRVAIANGSNNGQGEPFAPGDQVVLYSYSNALVSILGNVWAVPNLASHVIFDGRIRILFSDTRQTVTVTGTQPYDGAPGGWRGTMAQMDTVPAPYGDIVALHPNHCFIPTVSALAYDSPDLFHSVAGDADPLAHTPFDAIYSQATNQEHVAVTAENAAWIRNEIETGVSAVASAAAPPPAMLMAPAPSPAQGPVRIAFSLPRTGPVDLSVVAVDGREVARLGSGEWSSGPHEVAWSGNDRLGNATPAGVYFVRLAADLRIETRRFVRIR